MYIMYEYTVVVIAHDRCVHGVVVLELHAFQERRHRGIVAFNYKVALDSVDSLRKVLGNASNKYMYTVFLYLSDSAHHLEERLESSYAGLEVREHAMIVLALEGNARGYSRTVYKRVVLGPRSLDVLEVFYTLALVGILSKELYIISRVDGVNDSLVYSLGDLSIAARNYDSLTGIDSPYNIMKPEIFAEAPFI